MDSKLPDRARRVDEANLALFVGKRANVYSNKWKSTLSWNWSAFLTGPYWMLYRKMYLNTLFSVIAAAILGFVLQLLIGPFLSSLKTVVSVGIPFAIAFAFVVMVVFGLLGNLLYRHHAISKIGSAKRMYPDANIQANKIKSSGGTNLALPLTLFLVPAILAAGVFIWYSVSVYNKIDGLQKTKDESLFKKFEPVKEQEPPKWEGTDRVNILLLGGDSRGQSKNEPPRSDSLLLASFDPVTKKASLFSILRDTYVKIPEHGSDRINSALALGGPNLSMKTVGDLLGIPVQYYVYVDFEGFIALIDKVGGIDFEVEKNMKYKDSADGHQYDIDLKKGMQHLDGKTALQYVRFRHDAMSDFSRTERQRNFLKAIATKLQTTTSLIKLPEIIESISPYIETNLSANDILKLASLGYDTTVTGSEQLPPMELVEDRKVHGASVLAVSDEDKLKQFVQDTFNKTDASPTTTAPASGDVDGSGSGNDKGAGSSVEGNGQEANDNGDNANKDTE